LEFTQGKKARVFDRRRAVPDAGEVSLMAGKGEEGRNAALANQHRHVPHLVLWTDQERPASAKQQEFASAIAQKWERVPDISVERFCAADRRRGASSGLAE
jgi:hypothetical protein